MTRYDTKCNSKANMREAECPCSSKKACCRHAKHGKQWKRGKQGKKGKKGKEGKQGKRNGRHGHKVECRTLENGKRMCYAKRDLSEEELQHIANEWGLPICDGWGFPYVKGCFGDASNWSPHPGQQGPKQCIIKNPGNSNLAPGSIYTCGFLW